MTFDEIHDFVANDLASVEAPDVHLLISSLCFHGAAPNYVSFGRSQPERIIAACTANLPPTDMSWLNTLLLNHP